MEKKRLIFIINPISGAKKGVSLTQLIHEIFPKDEYETKIEVTKHRNHASEITKNLKNIPTTFVAIGGDGTINEVAKEILNSDSSSLGLVATGSGNGLSRSLQIPLDPEKALQRIKNGSESIIDTCSFNNIPFFCTAGVAFDALVAKDFDELPSRGLKTYFQASFRQFKTYAGTQITAKINGETVDENLFMMAFANAEQYGYGAKINPRASLSDGLIEVAIIKKMNLLRFGEFTSRLFTGTIKGFSLCRTVQTAKDIVLSTSSKIAHLDGEPIHFNGEATIKIHPNSLKIIL